MNLEKMECLAKMCSLPKYKGGANQNKIPTCTLYIGNKIKNLRSIKLASRGSVSAAATGVTVTVETVVTAVAIV